MLLEARQVTKRFGNLVANYRVDLQVRRGEIHAVLGENGAGKTTLMNQLYGLYQPDEGQILVREKGVRMTSPRDAIKLRIGMVHQHFMLVPTITVAENVILGLRSPREPFLDLRAAENKISELSRRYDLQVDPKAKVWQLPVGIQQRVEIIKALYRGADILILDEPTSLLSPQEVRQFFVVLRGMVKRGLCPKTVLI